MAILRNKSQDGFTIVDNYAIKDKRLSLKGTGLLVTMLSLPDYWDFSEAGLAAIVKDGLSSVRSGLKELEELGYLVRTRTRNENGQFLDCEWEILAVPISCDEPQLENRTLDNPKLDSTHNKTTKESTTKESNTKEYKKEEKETLNAIIESYTPNEELQQALKDFLKHRKTLKKPMTNRALKMLLSHLDENTTSDSQKTDAIDKAIYHGWRTVYFNDDSKRYKKAKNDDDPGVHFEL